MQTKVKREGGKVWIEGVKGFSPAEYADSVHGCQARILQTLGESLDYSDLLCYSGFAFRIGVNEEMCPSAGHPYCGYVCVENSNRALPWKTRVFDAMPGHRPEEDRAAFEAEARAAIRQSIDRGIPVHYGSEEDGLIAGYADDGRRWWCVHPYHKWGAEPFWHDEVGGMAGGNWPWGIAVWTEPKPLEDRVADRDLIVSALRQAVEMWETREPEKKYLCGDSAYGHWLTWLRQVDAGEVENPGAGMQGNGWYFDVLIHCRPIAGRWLREKAGSFGDEAGQHLLIAADHYTRLAELCLKDLGSPWELALPPNKLELWTSELRQEQITRLQAARDHDRAAVSEIKRALEALSTAPS